MVTFATVRIRAVDGDLPLKANRTAAHEVQTSLERSKRDLGARAATLAGACCRCCDGGPDRGEKEIATCYGRVIPADGVERNLLSGIEKFQRAKTGATMLGMAKRNSVLLLAVVGIGAIAIGSQAAGSQNAKYTVRTLALPDHGKGNITMDYIAYDAKTGYVWVPAINIGSVDVVDTSNNSVREIPGFATNEVEARGGKRAQGPSGVSIGDGLVYIGDRADSSVCAVDERTLARKTCGHIDSTPDGVVYVAPTKEVWVTAPRDNSVRILDSQSLRQKEN